MESPGSVTLWIDQLKAGAREAAQPLWDRYFHQLVQRIRRRLAAGSPRGADEEDVALSAFKSFYRAAENGRFPQLNDRDDLWQLLLVLTDRKTCDLMQLERRQRRGRGRVADEAALGQGDSTVDQPLAALAGQEPTPAFTA